MSQLTDNLSAIASIKSDIRAAIESKGVSMAGVSFGSYADKIGEITTTFVTESLTVINNGTYTPSQGVDGYSQVTVNVPQSVTGITEKDFTEKNYTFININNSASFVASSAFLNNTDIRTVNLPNCTIVNRDAFSGCRYLSEINLPNCEVISGAFKNTGLTSVELPNCTFLSGDAFTNCSYLTTVILPECRSISGAAFWNCKSLSYISLPKCSMIYGGATFSGCSSLISISLPECLFLSNSIFQFCKSLQNVYVPKCLSISNSCFIHCDALSSISLPECKVTGGIVFQYCSVLSELDLPGCGFLGGAIVNDCPNLTRANIPMVVTFSPWYGNAALNAVNLSEVYLCTDVYGCPTYSSVIGTSTSIHKGFGSVYVNVQYYSYYETASGWSDIISQIVSVGTSTVPLLSFNDGLLFGSTRGIASGFSLYVSAWRSNITGVSLPNCEFIDMSTFSGCSRISNMYIPDCKFIGFSAFTGCSSLMNLTLNQCTYIGGSAFGGCRNFDTLILKTSELCYIEQTTFWNTGGPSISFYVPSSLVSDYKSALYWSNYSSRIYPMEPGMEYFE